MVIMKLADVVQFIEETTGEFGITQLEMSPVPFADENIYMTGFRLDTPNPMIHLKVIRKIRLFGAACSSKQQIEYYMMNPDAEIWIDFDALDAFSLRTAINDITKKVYKSTGLEILTVNYTENCEDVERKIAYDSRRIACKEAMALRKECKGLKFHFSKATNKEHAITDLEFATAALE